MKANLKEVVNSDNWIITKIIQGRHGKIRVDAKTRFHIADGVNFYSEWITKDYADRLLREKCGKKSNELSCWVW